jgi:hypothetical protein
MMKFVHAAIFSALLVFGPIAACAQTPGGFSLGPSLGWSVGSGYAFNWHVRPYSDKYRLDYHLGAICTYSFGNRLSVGLNLLYQRGTYQWEVTSSFLPPDSGSKPYHFWSAALTGIVDIIKIKTATVFLEGGGGLCWTDWGSFEGIYYDVLGGPGLRINLTNGIRPLALAFRAAFHHLIDPREDDTTTASFFRFGASLEIPL